MESDPSGPRSEPGDAPRAGAESDEFRVEDGSEGDDGTTPQRYNIMYMPADYTLGTLYDMWKNKSIAIPEFQRGYVWTPRQASRLIESFAMDLPVPPVFLMMNDDQNAVVIDGMQRLLTVFYFFGGRYEKKGWRESGSEFKIVGINKENELYGKRFADLPEPTQKRLKNQVLRSMLIRQIPPSTGGTAIYHIFERLNTGGTLLSEQEIRNCIYSGGLNDLLRDINGDKDWRLILGKPHPDPRMKDVQLALRCMALLHGGGGYRAPMKDFLSRFMHDARNPADGFIQEEKKRFGRVCRSVVEGLGERPFHNDRGALRAPLLDAVFVAIAQNGGRCPENAKDRIEALKSDGEFASFSGTSSADTASVKGRLAAARRILFG